jgi:hypothetical protein
MAFWTVDPLSKASAFSDGISPTADNSAAKHAASAINTPTLSPNNRIKDMVISLGLVTCLEEIRATLSAKPSVFFRNLRRGGVRRQPRFPSETGFVYCTFAALICKLLIINGSNKGNRTLVIICRSPDLRSSLAFFETRQAF